jgi:hypothetical protein
VLVHEIGHLVRAHAERADALGADYDHARWATACDLALNDDLLAAGVPLPAGVVTPAMFGLAEGGIEEAYYAALAQNPRPSAMTAASGEGGRCGSGAGEPRASWELPADDPAGPALSQADATMTCRRVAHAVREHAARRSRGQVPASLRFEMPEGPRWCVARVRPGHVPPFDSARRRGRLGQSRGAVPERVADPRMPKSEHARPWHIEVQVKHGEAAPSSANPHRRDAIPLKTGAPPRPGGGDNRRP